MKIWILHGYADGLIDPVVSLEYPVVYEAMKTAYEATLDGEHQTPDEKESSYLRAFSATAVVCGDWHEWEISVQEITDFAENQKETEILSLSEKPHMKNRLASE